MLHTELRENWPAGSGEEDCLVVFTRYGHGSHLGQVTRISRSNFHSPYPWMLHIKFHFDWPRGFRDENFLKSVYGPQTLAMVKR